MQNLRQKIQLGDNTNSSPSLRKRRCRRTSKAQLKKVQEIFSDECSLEIASSTYEDESAFDGEKQDKNRKLYKTREEITFLEQQLIKDPSWSRKTVQLWKRTLGMRTDQIYKWGYDRKKAMKKYSKLFPQSNGIKARFAKVIKEVNKNDMNDVVDNIVDTMKHYKMYSQQIEESSDDDDDSDNDIHTQSVIFHFDESNEAHVFLKKEAIQNEYFSDPIDLNEFSMRLNSIDWFNEELYLTLSRDNNFY